MPTGLPEFQMFFADHIVGVMVCIIAPLLVVGTRTLSDADVSFSGEEKIRLYHQNGLFLTVIALVVVTVWRLPARSLTALGFAWPEWSAAAGYVLGAAVLLYAADLLAQYGWRTRRNQAREDFRRGAGVILPTNNLELGHFFFLSMAAGVGEEIIFRGFLLHYLTFWFGHSLTETAAAALVSSAVFAYLHGYQGWVAMVKIFFLALLFAALFVLTRSLWPVIILHTLIDMLSGWLGVRLVRTSEDGQSPGDAP
jgi:membrane protease YdiL (CAAX protease family)